MPLTKRLPTGEMSATRTTVLSAISATAQGESPLTGVAGRRSLTASSPDASIAVPHLAQRRRLRLGSDRLLRVGREPELRVRAELDRAVRVGDDGPALVVDACREHARALLR